MYVPMQGERNVTKFSSCNFFAVVATQNNKGRIREGACAQAKKGKIYTLLHEHFCCHYKISYQPSLFCYSCSYLFVVCVFFVFFFALIGAW